LEDPSTHGVSGYSALASKRELRFRPGAGDRIDEGRKKPIGPPGNPVLLEKDHGNV
jgi:hypothetical protein